MDKEEEIAALTNVQLLNALVSLKRRQDIIIEQMNFIVDELLKTELLSLKAQKKFRTGLRYANRRITELDNSHHGLVGYIHEMGEKRKGDVI